MMIPKENFADCFDNDTEIYLYIFRYIKMRWLGDCRFNAIIIINFNNDYKCLILFQITAFDKQIPGEGALREEDPSFPLSFLLYFSFLWKFHFFYFTLTSVICHNKCLFPDTNRLIEIQKPFLHKKNNLNDLWIKTDTNPF